MVAFVDIGILENAIKQREQYPDLIVRASGFSTVFVDLAPNIQQEMHWRCKVRKDMRKM